MTISLEEARDLVGWSDDHEIVWQVREFALGWCFWVQSRRFLETGDVQDVLIGGIDYFVIADSGQVIRAGASVGYLNAEAHLLDMSRMGLPLDQPHFESFTRNQLRQDPRFLSQEELLRILSEPDP